MTPTKNDAPSEITQKVRDLAQAMRHGLESRRTVGSLPFGRTKRATLDWEARSALQSYADLAQLPALAKPGPWSALIRLSRRILRGLLRPWLAVQTNYNQLVLEVIEAMQGEMDLIQAQFEDGYCQAVNKELGPEGTIAKASLWFNPPIGVQIHDGQPHVVSVTERIIEPFFVHSRLPPPPAEVLDLGSAESLNAIEIASFGYRVVAVDLRPLPVRNPLLSMIRGDIARLPFADNSFDVAVSLSTLEHVGLHWYGETSTASTDHQVIAEVSRVLRPGGRFFLTIPFGQAALTPVQRIYDTAMLDQLLTPFLRVETLYGIRVEQSWTVTSEAALAEEVRSVDRVNAVALVVAEKKEE